MSRPPRLVIPGQPLHVIQRGNNRSQTFADTRDYIRYKSALRVTSQRTGCAIHAYALMGNHVHLLLTPRDKYGAARMMQALGRRYVRYFNRRHARTGTLWEGRYRSALIDSDYYFFVCCRYIELNPVRAHMVEDPGLYAWTSFRRNAKGEHDPVITPHILYRRLGAQPRQQEAAYRGLFTQALQSSDVDAIRDATKAGSALATDRVVASREEGLRRVLAPLPLAKLRRDASFRGAGVSPAPEL